MNKQSILVFISILISSSLGYLYGSELLGFFPSIIIGGSFIAIALYLSVAMNEGTAYKKILSGLRAVVSGDYGYSFKNSLKSNGEVGEIALELDKILLSVNHMIAKMKVSGEQTSYESEKVYKQLQTNNEVSSLISQSVEKIAYDSTEQKEYIDQIATNSEEMSSLSNTIALKCENNYNLAITTENNVNEVKNYVDKLLEGIEYTGNISTTSAEKIHKLKNKIEAISSSITVVTKISEQTNLLALNASIESARAGEAGRGFAVVADEVRKLAEESKLASENIVKIVKEVVLETDTVVEQIENNHQNVSQNIEMVAEVKSLIDKNVAYIEEMEHEISSIMEITLSQAKESEKISSSILQVSDLSSNIASQTQNVYASCEEQTSSAEEMMTSCHVLANSSKSSLEQVKEFSKGIVIDEKTKIEINRLVKELANLSTSDSLKSMDYSRHKNSIDELVKKEKNFSVVYSASVETQNLHYINLDLKMDTVAFREWYSYPVHTKSSYVSEVYVPLGSDSPCITISVPIVNDSVVTGVLGADLVLSDIS